jgi:hypothetical protein
MIRPTIREHNTETDEIIDREMTDDELAYYEAGKAELQANLKAEQDKAATKQAVLTKLGLTADEVAALLG